MRNLFFTSGLIFISALLFSMTEPRPKELGKVDWYRDYDLAIATAQKVNKPILILFQEVPGCSTCVNFGNNVLSHPLIVDAIENEFVPLAIFNNKKGKDYEVLKNYNEPAWNNPVVRIVDQKGKDLTKRIARYNTKELVDGMIESLEKSKQAIPAYLDFLHSDLQARSKPLEEATYSMYCFWTGEAALGSIDGVHATKAGFMDGKEVVKVSYDPEVIGLNRLTKLAVDMNCGKNIYLHDAKHIEEIKETAENSAVKQATKFRADTQPKYYIYNTHYKFLPMLPNQANKINTLLRNNKNVEHLLSPSQIDLANTIKKNPKHKLDAQIDVDNFMVSWDNVNSGLK